MNGRASRPPPVAFGGGEPHSGARRDGAWRRARLGSARLYLCTDRRGGSAGDLERFLDGVLAAGVDIVQLRDKAGRPAEVRAAAETFRAAAERHGALFVLNDDPRLALEAGADGVHVGQADMPPGNARQVVGSEVVVGRSTHTTAEVDRALGEDCDYLGVGPVHATPTKEGRPGVGLGPVRHAARVSDRPFFVTGGMSPDTAPQVLGAGAHGLVVVRALTEAPDPAAVVRRLVELFVS